MLGKHQNRKIKGRIVSMENKKTEKGIEGNQLTLVRSSLLIKSQDSEQVDRFQITIRTFTSSVDMNESTFET